MNILLTSAGRRTSLLLAFMKAAHKIGSQVFAADIDPLAPACALADKAFRLPRISDPNYLTTLMALARTHGVRLIVPTIDTELSLLAQNADAFRAEGIHNLISTPQFVASCGDKWETVLAFRAEGIAVPDSWLPEFHPDSLPQELFLKPRNGSASANIHICRRETLDQTLPLVPNPIIQECLQGKEITVDALLDTQGRPIHFVPRERIRTLGGESIQGVTLDSPEIDTWLESVLHACGRLGARGPITIQAFLTDRGPVLTEINPRFGGGFPLALAAGGDYPTWILGSLKGEPLEPRLGQYRRGLYMTRHYQEIFLETLPWPR